MGLTRKHFQMVADVINERHLCLPDAKKHALAGAFSERLSAEFSNFDRERFMGAIEYEDPDYWAALAGAREEET